jgi:hypothetical protein
MLGISNAEIVTIVIATCITIIELFVPSSLSAQRFRFNELYIAISSNAAPLPSVLFSLGPDS